ncbi:porin [Methylocapsa palsarum]|uniref:Porin subfamily protein n=1 Tax=Methylocapsa palsarum TaxID=1612308 RepID=A0A1I3X135_9HYPH|nr:porin [Methylocapsa palsarum]SFK13448.1 Porin subfamily protein [Methylocapsa palsarum]
MSLRTQSLFICCGFAAFFAAAQTGRANDLPYGKSSAQSRANAQCAVYGPGFVAAPGSDACIWVGGHVRMEFGSKSSRSPNNGWASGGTVPAAMRVQDGAEPNSIAQNVSSGGPSSGSRGHLRPQDGDVTGSIEAR